MTDQEAIKFYVKRLSLKIWQRLLFFVTLIAIGCWLMSPLLWNISSRFAHWFTLFVGGLFLVSGFAWNVIALPKHVRTVFELRSFGYQKWRRFQSDFFVRSLFRALQPTAQERVQHPWLLPTTILAVTFPILGLVLFIVSFYLG